MCLPVCHPACICTPRLCLFACCIVGSVSAASKGHPSPLVFWIPIPAQPSEESCSPASHLQISPFTHVLLPYVRDQVISMQAQSAVPTAFSKTFTYLTFAQPPFFCFPSKPKMLERVYCRWRLHCPPPMHLHSTAHQTCSHHSTDRFFPRPPTVSTLPILFQQHWTPLPTRSSKTFYSLGFLDTASDCFYLAS